MLKKGFLFIVIIICVVGCGATQNKSQISKADSANHFLTGIHTNITQTSNYDNEFAVHDTLLSIAGKSGVGFIRTGLNWNNIEPKPGKWNWKETDEIVEKARKHGIKILAVLHSPPSWARPLRDHEKEWNKYVDRVSRRYKGKIMAWEIWNEPNISNPVVPGLPPVELSEILKRAYKILKDNDPESTVIMGAMASKKSAFPFWRKIFSKGALQYCDAVGVHPYKHYSKQLLAYLKRIRTLMSNYDAEKPLWITEFGSSAFHNSIHPLKSPVISELIEKSAARLFSKASDVPVYYLPEGNASNFMPPLIKQLKSRGWNPTAIDITKKKDQHKLKSTPRKIVISPALKPLKAKYADVLYKTIRSDGGILVSIGGLPLTAYPTQNGIKYRTTYADRFLMAKKRVNINRPVKRYLLRPAKGMTLTSDFDSLFFADRLVRNPRRRGVAYTQMLTAFRKNDTQIGDVAAFYTYHSKKTKRKSALLEFPTTLSASDSYSRQAQKLGKTLLGAWISGVKAFTVFEFMDKKFDTNNKYFGMLEHDLHAKPAFSVLKLLANITTNYRAVDFKKNKDGITIKMKKMQEKMFRYIGWGAVFQKQMKNKDVTVNPLVQTTSSESSESSIYISS